MAHSLTLSSSSHSTRKRRRCDSLNNAGPPQKYHAMTRTYKRDDTYYFDDGSCVLLVEDVLFNVKPTRLSRISKIVNTYPVCQVHRSILSKDSSSFKLMFSLPSGERPVEGTSDDNPIVLSGDNAAEFRHFLWTLYALYVCQH